MPGLQALDAPLRYVEADHAFGLLVKAFCDGNCDGQADITQPNNGNGFLAHASVGVWLRGGGVKRRVHGARDAHKLFNIWLTLAAKMPSQVVQ